MGRHDIIIDDVSMPIDVAVGYKKGTKLQELALKIFMSQTEIVMLKESIEDLKKRNDASGDNLIWGKKEIMELIGCKDAKANGILKWMLNFGYAEKVGRSYQTTKDKALEFFDMHLREENYVL